MGRHSLVTRPYAVDPALSQHLDELIAELRDRSITPGSLNVLRCALELGISDATADELVALLECRIQLGGRIMTDDLKEAFAVAGVEFLTWNRRNEEIRHTGPIYINFDGTRGYVHEPTVSFCGRDLPISEICDLATRLVGPLPLLVKWIFDVIPDIHALGIEVETYPEAVNTLRFGITEELASQERYPLPGPSIADNIRKKEREQVCNIIEQMIVAHPNGQHGDLPRLTPEEWRVVLATIDGGRP
jgi:hypothetical protein